MIVLQILMLIFCMVILPFGIGVLPGRWLKKEDRTLTGIWISGYLVLFALFELVGIPVVLFTVYHGFSRLCLIFGLLAGVGFLAGVVRLLKKKEDYSSLLEGSFPEKRTVEEWVYLVLFALLLGFQLYMAFTRASFDGDDAYYGVQGLIAQQQDTLYRINPNTGRSAPLDIRHALALMPIYEAFLGKMSGIHATIIAHSAAPIGLILLTYALYFQIGRKLFPGKRTEILRFLILMALFQIFGNVSIYTSETFFLTRTWQGKSFAGNFVLPAVLWIFLELFKPVQRGEKRKQTGYWILLALLNLAGGASSSLAVLLSCLMSAGLSLIAAVWKRKPWILVKTVLSCIPGGIYVLFYLLLTHGIIG